VSPQSSATTSSTSYKDAATRTVTAGGVDFAYRELGQKAGTPVILLTHVAANLDNWDPRVVDGIAAKHHVIAFDNRGVGASSGKVPDTIEAMANDAVTFIRALGFDRVDILGFSMGGMIAQVIALQEPQLVRKLILTGTGPAGGEGIDKRTENRDKAMSLSGYRAQLKAIHRWGLQDPADLSVIQHPALVANGDNDRMVPTSNTVDLDRRLPNSELVIYPDAGHGGIFQHHHEFVATTLEFLDR
jgi:pimeloyl-ACP methyl ester carboxylesterase